MKNEFTNEKNLHNDMVKYIEFLTDVYDVPIFKITYIRGLTVLWENNKDYKNDSSTICLRNKILLIKPIEIFYNKKKLYRHFAGSGGRSEMVYNVDKIMVSK